jgi:small subunit ribosomal protein S1
MNQWTYGRDEYESMPPELDEGYWAALLKEGEFSGSAAPDMAVRVAEADPFDAADEVTISAPMASEDDWEAIRRVTLRDDVMELRATGYNRGGILVEWRTLRGFVPASQLLDFPSSLNPSVRRAALNGRVGQMLRLRVIELNAEKNRLIFSERAAQVGPGERANVMQALLPGDTITGTVTNLCDFGAFVDIGGIEGLIHISELSWGRVSHPNSILKRGQTVEVYVLDIDRDGGRVALSLKRLHPDPWATVEQHYYVGQIIEGVITNVVDFGAFASIEDGLEGLIHVSELAEGHFLHPRNVVSEGQRVRARVMVIDGNARRLGLTLRLTDTP